MQGELDHIVVNTQDLDGMLRFYSEVVGLTIERLALYRRREAPFPSVRIGSDSLIDLFPPELWRDNAHGTHPAAETRLNHFCLAVPEADWHALRQRLEAHGIEVHRGPVASWGARGNGTSVYFYDPEGNQIEVRYF